MIRGSKKPPIDYGSEVGCASRQRVLQGTSRRRRVLSAVRAKSKCAYTLHSASGLRFVVSLSHITFFQQMHKNSFLRPVNCVQKNTRVLKNYVQKLQACEKSV